MPLLYPEEVRTDGIEEPRTGTSPSLSLIYLYHRPLNTVIRSVGTYNE